MSGGTIAPPCPHPRPCEVTIEVKLSDGLLKWSGKVDRADVAAALVLLIPEFKGFQKL